jgi:hypothetical protein
MFAKCKFNLNFLLIKDNQFYFFETIDMDVEE